MNRQHQRDATTREKVVQVILGLLVFVITTLLALGLLVVLVKESHLGQ